MTDIEQRLIEAARNGEWLECAAPDNVVRAELIRKLLLGHHGQLDPRGICLEGARIEGVLDLDRVNASVALYFVDCTIDEPIKVRNASLPDLGLHGGLCAGLNADGVRVDGSLTLRGGLRIAVDTKGGAIRLLDAHVTGDLIVRDVEISNTAGTALHMNGIRVDGNIFLREKVRITGHGGDGAVDLVGGHIGETLEFDDVEVSNSTGTAVWADRLRVAGRLFLLGQTRLSGGGGNAVISLSGACVDGGIDSGREVVLEAKAASAPVLSLEGMTAGGSVSLPPSLACTARGRRWECTNKGLVRLDDFGYTSLGPEWDWRRWLHLIRCHTPAYHASAYQRLAAVERAAGHDGTVRRILMAQQTDLRRRSPASLGGWMTRRFHWMWGVLAGYGYRARRTAAALLLVLTIAGALGWWAGQVPTRPGHLAAERVASAAAAAGIPCSTVELIGLGLDRGLPLATTGMRSKCDLDTTTRRGGAFTYAIWATQFLVWGLATLALAGYTNLVRKPG
ncbi:hypothetical protein [Lentzea flava]|uniref:Membrane-associated oxidoreductase n=1 Tax=Lentzea flava TaxID=103732 RepID=A0ABQ2V886_9PSEU|nr:hypothetical protein [Lentzea flava]MCP2203740.1 hypothetical protein [Lentzea flava]GGU71349.1 hypothetical protein GCM10010178_73790 [Lentzea flava]